MGVGEKHAVWADDRFRSTPLRARIHRHALADEAVLADDEADRLSAILQVLRRMPDCGERKDPRTRPHRGVAGETDVRNEAHAVSQRHLRPDMAERSNSNLGAEPRAVFDNGSRMN